VSGQLHAPAALPPEKGPLISIGQEVGWVSKSVWTRCWRENSQPLPGLEPPNHRARSSALYHWAISAPSISSCSHSNEYFCLSFVFHKQNILLCIHYTVASFRTLWDGNFSLHIDKVFITTISMSSFDVLNYARGWEMFLFTTASRPALGPTQPPIKRVSGILSPGAKRPGSDTDHSPYSSKVTNVSSYTSTSPIRLHGVVLS
jgi:hypothetical protein